MRRGLKANTTTAAERVTVGPIRAIKLHQVEDGFAASLKYLTPTQSWRKVYVKADSIEDLMVKITREVIRAGIAAEPAT
jgi:hypothetical protein